MAVPDHSTFSKNRHGRFRESDLLRQVFDTTVRRCMAEGLVGGDGFAVDASMIKADANRQRSVPGSEWRCPEAANHAVREYLSVLDDAAFGAATPVVPKFSSHADPASRWTGANGGLAFFAYCTKLPDRSEARCDPGCGGDHRSPPSRGDGAAKDDRPCAGALRPLARAAGSGRRLWFGREPRLAGA